MTPLPTTGRTVMTLSDDSLRSLLANYLSDDRATYYQLEGRSNEEARVLFRQSAKAGILPLAPPKDDTITEKT